MNTGSYHYQAGTIHFNRDINYGTNFNVPSTAEIHVFPNPVADESKISITLKEKSEVDCYISDALGRSIFKSETLHYGPGQYFLPLDLSKLENPGFYLLSIKIDNYLISKKIIVIN